MKKTLTLLLALLMSLSLLPPPAAGAADTVSGDDSKLTQATNLLSALGIINGYEDGSFKLEKVTTRAEMAKMLITALGYGDIDAATPNFTDCQTHWARGYIALAADLGIVKGKGNNLFAPNSPATYGQAATMLLRTLGYTDESVTGGESHKYSVSAYVTKAAELGLDVGVSNTAATAVVTRGDAFVMTEHALTQTVVVIGSDGKAQPTGELLLDKLAVANLNFYVSAEELRNGHAVDLTDYLYQSLDVWVNSANKVVRVIRSSSETYTGNPSVNKSSSPNSITATLWGGSTVTNLLSAVNIPVYQNGAEVQMTAAQLRQLDCDVKFVINTQNRIVGAICDVYAPPVLVEETYRSVNRRFCGYPLPMTKDWNVDYASITVTRDSTCLEDIQRYDIVECAVAADKSAIKILVTRKSVEGRVTKIDGDDCYINGAAYQLNGPVLTAGDEGIFYLDSSNRIAAFRAKQIVSAEQYGIVVDMTDGEIGNAVNKWAIGSYPKLQLVGMDGTVSILDAAVTLDGNGKITFSPAGMNIQMDGAAIKMSLIGEQTALFNADQKLVKYTLDKDGRISSVSPVAAGFARMKTASKNFLADHKTVLLNYCDGAYQPITAKQLSSEEVSFCYVGDSSGWPLVIVNNGIKTEAPAERVVITGWAQKTDEEGNSVYEITALRGGETCTYLTAPSRFFGIHDAYRCKVVELHLDADRRVESISAYSGPRVLGAKAATLTGSHLILTSDAVSRHYFSDDMVIYRCDSEGAVTVGDLSDVQLALNSQAIDLYYLADGTVGYLVLNPQHYVPPYVPPAVTTHYGLLLGMEGTTELYFATETGEPAFLPTSGGLGVELREPTVVCYTMSEGRVTSVERLEQGGPITLGAVKGELPAGTLVFEKAVGTDCTTYRLMTIDVTSDTDWALLAGKAVHPYLDGTTLVAIVFQTQTPSD